MSTRIKLFNAYKEQKKLYKTKKNTKCYIIQQ